MTVYKLRGCRGSGLAALTPGNMRVVGLGNDIPTLPCDPAGLPISGHGLETDLSECHASSSRIAHRCPELANEPSQVVLTPLPRPAENVPQLIPEPGSLLHSLVLQYRELLDSLPMDAYTHGCILHPELTTDSMIPKYATTEIRSKSPSQRGCPGLLSPTSHPAPPHLPFYQSRQGQRWENGKAQLTWELQAS